MVILRTIAQWYHDLGMIGKCIVIFEVLNVLTFVGVRAFLHISGNLASPITVLKAADPSDNGTTLTIALGGTMGTGSCFNVFLPYCGTGEVIYLDHSGLGFSAKSQYCQLVDYITESGAKNIHIISLGPGDSYAVKLEHAFDGFNGYKVSTLPVNPEPSYKVMNGPSRWGSLLGDWIVKIFTAPLGWLNTVEWIPKTGEGFSIAYTTSQFGWTGTVNAGVHKEGCVKKAILSIYDQFFRNKENSSASGKHLEESYFPDLTEKDFYYIESDSRNTIDKAPAYESALDQIFPTGTWE